MGLDCFWKPTNKSTPPKFVRKLELCGGLFSGNGEGSFRGKVYNGFIEEITKITLYQQEIPPRIIKKIAQILNNTPLEKLKMVARKYDISDQEMYDLICMFTTYAKSNYKIIGWW